ncbi:BTAD domain-containing putative transcriptional regulator [Dactylosporangium sp. NPDC000244]|uniref:BTAD domain-containing putative transcriptional regulator n=1 Tax=Dactylosporangium sp. NPDC000244 TaxID=3154365 RepID=UPI003316BCAA
MQFGVLGPLAVTTDAGEAVVVPGIKVRVLLADLLLHRNRVVSADRLIDDLWGDDPPANPAGALQVRVSQLRKALNDAEPGARDLVESRAPGYLLRTDAVDADRFGALAGSDDVADLTAALALWRGEPFADMADGEFVRAEVERLTQQRLAVHERLAEARLARGEPDLVAADLAGLVARYPLRERLRALQLRALYAAGRPTEALDSYAELRDRLAEELGLDPGPELVTIHRQILGHDAALAPAAGPEALAPAAGPGALAPAAGPGAGPGALAPEAGPEATVPTRKAPEVKPPAALIRNALPARLDELVGRAEALAELRPLLARQRLVTLVGPGGVGKTRLATEAVRDLNPADVVFVELAPVPAGGDIAERVLAALGVREAAGAGLSADDRLLAALGPRAVTVVLDNCEHVIAPAAALTGRLLRDAPGVRVLATSREPLGIGGECVWDVPPLSLPDDERDLDAVRRSAAARLFTARAAAQQRTFRLDERTAPEVARLCRRLDGLPLALELAATRVRALGLHGVVERLDDRFALLATQQRDVPERQRTLTAVITWSWDLLDAEERRVLARLSVFADGCTPEAAEEVCGTDLDVLARLVDRSLIVVDDGPRYRLLESVAAFAADRLRDGDEVRNRQAGERVGDGVRNRQAGERVGDGDEVRNRQAGERLGDGDEIRDRHAAYYTALAERADPHLRGPEQQRWLAVLDAESANLGRALDRTAGDPRLPTALGWYWFLRGRLTEARRAFGPVAAGPWKLGFALLLGAPVVARDVRAALAGAPGVARWFVANAVFDRGDLALADEVLPADEHDPWVADEHDPWVEAATSVTRATFAHAAGDLDALEHYGTRAAALFAGLGDRWGRLQATDWVGGLAEMRGEHERAAALHREGLRWAEELALWPEVASKLSWLAWLAVQTRDYGTAREFGERALARASEQGNPAAVVFAELGLGIGARRAGRLDEAETHLGRLADQGRGEPQPALYLPMVLVELGYAAEQRGDPDEARALHLEALDAADAMGAPRDAIIAVEGLAAVTAADEDAARLLGAAAKSRETYGVAAAPAERDEIERVTQRLLAALGAERFKALHAEGGEADVMLARERRSR